MEAIKLTLSALLIMGIIFSGCQKKEDLSDLIIEPTEEESEFPLQLVEDEDPILAIPNDFGFFTSAAKTAELKGYVIDILEFNELLENIFIETFVQSEVAGLPGFRGGEGGMGRTNCPASSLSDPVNYPTTMTLDYGASGCMPVSGLEISGVLEIDFSGSLEEVGTIVTLRPQDDFTIAGRDIDVSDDCALKLHSIDNGMYNLAIATGENISMTAANGAVTSVTYVDPDNILLYDDNGSNSSPLDVLDDTFTFLFADMTVHCGDGTTLTVAAEEEVVYDLNCACIQDGTLNVFEGRDLFQNVDFGYPAEAGGEGICDDEILVTTFVDERMSGEEIVSCPL